jgi:hypothetical protein
MKLIDRSRATVVETILETKVRDALVLEVAEAYGLVTDGKLTKGATGRVTILGDRDRRAFRVEVSFDRVAAGQAALPAPEVSK